MNLGGVLFLVVLALGVWFAVATYNRLVGLRRRWGEAWSDIDVQLKRRTELAPNLVEMIKGYAAHELDQVVRARSVAVAAETPQDRARAEGALTAALRQLVALAEAYPELKASEGFGRLQAQLAEIEEAVQSSADTTTPSCAT